MQLPEAVNTPGRFNPSARQRREYDDRGQEFHLEAIAPHSARNEVIRQLDASALRVVNLSGVCTKRAFC
jgi:hypothetical protein